MSERVRHLADHYGAEIPSWLRARVGNLPQALPDRAERMEIVNDLAAENIAAGTGGPFAALVVDGASGALLAAGVNLVLSSGLATAHAEVVALSLAQAGVGGWNLGAAASHPVLVVNAQPCAMCLGALIWSGVRRVEFAALGSDVERLTGFDEGPVPADWLEQLERRGISVETGTGEKRALGVLEDFRRLVDAGSLPLYNGTGRQRQPVSG
jgi:tRNA(Arg) A34 adenosine deaminase TadA